VPRGGSGPLRAIAAARSGPEAPGALGAGDEPVDPSCRTGPRAVTFVGCAGPGARPVEQREEPAMSVYRRERGTNLQPLLPARPSATHH
jgi:hypothetical protein